MWKIRGPGLVEDITDEIREWFIIWYNEVGHFDVYPAAHLGGSVLIATGQTMTPEEFLAAKSSKQAKGKGGASGRKTATREKASKKKGRPPWMPETKAFTFLDDANQNFITHWSRRDDLDDRSD